MAADIERRGTLWTGRTLTALAVLFLIFDATVKLLQLAPAVDATAQLGFEASVLVPLGIIEALCLAAYLVPQTSVAGAILWTGYLGGAVASQLRVGNPLVSHVLFPVYVAALLWGGLWLRRAQLRAVVPLATS
jgi:DoxX-like family